MTHLILSRHQPAAVALFALVISFVLFRTWRSRRRGAHFIGYDHTEGFARLLGIGSNIEDSSVPPKLWEARFVPYSDKPQVQTGNRSVWNNLMPVAASLPVSLYMQLGAADGAFNDKAKTESRTHSTPSNANNPASAAVPTVGANEHDNDGDENEEKKDLDEVMPGSVNISVLIAMPEPPKRKDALPELMLGTAAVPIYSSQRHDDTTMSSSLRTSTTATVSAGVARMTDVRYFPPTTVSAQATAPTRAQLLALVAAARQAKDRQCKLRNNEKQRSQERSCSGNEQQSPQSSGSPRRS